MKYSIRRSLGWRLARILHPFQCDYGTKSFVALNITTKEGPKKQVLPGIEPGLPEDSDSESESGVITATY
jgi:hypothetical protein